jgi:hypothetical protein
MKHNMAIIQPIIESTSDWIFLVGIQVFLLAVFVFMISFLCKLLKRKNPGKSNKKECILVWFMSAIAWFIIVQIVWILTYTQFIVTD